MEKAKFNVGDKVLYRSPHARSNDDIGVILEIDYNRFSFKGKVGYYVNWDRLGGNEWISDTNLTLIQKKQSLTLDETKVLVKETEQKLKDTIENILKEFEQKTGIKPEFFYNGYNPEGSSTGFRAEIK